MEGLMVLRGNLVYGTSVLATASPLIWEDKLCIPVGEAAPQEKGRGWMAHGDNLHPPE